ncbi:MAG: hypothetical protein P0S94_03680, partial [Simkaniaceae bacterium]|nr:hypothetical protein [Simkaniaceae bacterium]
KSIENINEIVNRLQIPMRYIDILANIALIAFEKDPQDCFEKIIEIGKNIKNNFKITVLAKAIEEKNTACMNAINLDLSLISIKQRDALLLVAAFNDLKDMTKTLLESGPTTQYKRNLIFNLISNTEIKSILSPYQNVLDPPKPPISFKDVEENPQMHLDQIAEDGIPDFITLEEDPVAIDAGGLTQQYISTLLTACIKNGIIQSSHGMAIVIDESAKDLENIGKLGEFFNQIALWNPYSKKKFFMPWIFEPRFYDLIGTIVKNPKTSDELLLVQVAKSLETEDDAVAAKLVLDPDNQELKDLYSEAMLLDDDEDPIKIAEGEMLTYVQAAKLLSSKLEESTRRLLKKLPADQICSTFQGIPSSSETLLASLQYDKTNEDPLFQQEVKWIKEKIENATPEWRKQFVQSITGNENLGPGIKIKITANRYSNGQIVVHTCNQTLELPTSEDPPTDDDAQKNFLSALDFAIEYKGYNTA